MRGKGPAPRGRKIRASRGLSPWRRYSTSSTSMVNCPLVVMAADPEGSIGVVGVLVHPDLVFSDGEKRNQPKQGVRRAHQAGETAFGQAVAGKKLRSIGVVHLGPLPGAPRWQGSLDAVLEHAVAHQLATANVTRLGMPDRLVAHATRKEQLAEVGLDPTGIAKRVRDAVLATQSEDVKV